MGWGFGRRADARDAAPSARRGDSGNDTEGGRTDQVALRTRARRRLIGAAALLLAVAILLPMVLDKEPRPVPDTIPIDIPSEKTPFSPRLALSAPPAAGVAPATPLPDAAPVQEGKGEPAHAAERAEMPRPTVDKGAVPAQAKPSAAPTAEPADRTADAKRARDILEGKTTETTAVAPASRGKYLLQAAALGSESAARELAARLQRAGFASFTERTETKDGVRYRVRLGPYATRDEAERARARLRAIGIHASVVTA